MKELQIKEVIYNTGKYKVPQIYAYKFQIQERFPVKELLQSIQISPYFNNTAVENRENTYVSYYRNDTYILTYEIQQDQDLPGTSARALRLLGLARARSFASASPLNFGSMSEKCTGARCLVRLQSSSFDSRAHPCFSLALGDCPRRRGQGKQGTAVH